MLVCAKHVSYARLRKRVKDALLTTTLFMATSTRAGHAWARCRCVFEGRACHSDEPGRCTGIWPQRCHRISWNSICGAPDWKSALETASSPRALAWRAEGNGIRPGVRTDL